MFSSETTDSNRIGCTERVLSSIKKLLEMEAEVCRWWE